MAELVGPIGEVTTVDIDPDVTERARQCLASAGYERLNVVLADAEHGVAEYDPTTGSSSPSESGTSLPHGGISSADNAESFRCECVV
jgi:hypothetical protein